MPPIARLSATLVGPSPKQGINRPTFRFARHRRVKMQVHYASIIISAVEGLTLVILSEVGGLVSVILSLSKDDRLLPPAPRKL